VELTNELLWQISPLPLRLTVIGVKENVIQKLFARFRFFGKRWNRMGQPCTCIYAEPWDQLLGLFFYNNKLINNILRCSKVLLRQKGQPYERTAGFCRNVDICFKLVEYCMKRIDCWLEVQDICKYTYLFYTWIFDLPWVLWCQASKQLKFANL